MCVPITETVSADTRIADTPCLLHSITTITSAGGHGVNVYDDNFANDERLMLALESPNNESYSFNFNPPIVMHRGLYLDLTASCDYVTVVYSLVTN